MEMTRREKLLATGIAKYGSEEKYRQAMREYGAKARRDTPRGFAKMDKETVNRLSKLGVEARAKKGKAM